MWPFTRRTGSVTPATDADPGGERDKLPLVRRLADVELAVEGLLERESTRAARERQRRRRDQSSEGGVNFRESPAADPHHDVGAGAPQSPSQMSRAQMWADARKAGLA